MTDFFNNIRAKQPIRVTALDDHNSFSAVFRLRLEHARFRRTLPFRATLEGRYRNPDLPSAWLTQVVAAKSL
jgi:hypothetical protein